VSVALGIQHVVRMRRIMQGDQNVSVRLMITVQKTRKNILNGFNHLP
jgi:hypothetical protein